MLTLSLFIKTIKKYANNISVSDETFFRDFFGYFIYELDIKNKNSEDYDFKKSTISNIMNQKEDVPTVIREAISDYSAPPTVNLAMTAFVEEQLNSSRIDIMVAELKEIISTDRSLSESAKQTISSQSNMDLISMLFIETIKLPNVVLQGTKVLWQQGSNSLNLMTGDIIKIAFNEKGSSTKKIVVIPVNSTFETRLSVNSENDIYPLVSENTIHGKWLVDILKEIPKEELDGRISDYLHKFGTKPIGNCYCPGGKSEQYAIGDTAVIQNKDTIFYLLAISDFDTKNKAHSSKDLIEKSITRLLEYYDDIGQGYELYLPLLGTGKSRANLTTKQSYELIKTTVISNCSIVNGTINIVVLEKMAHELV